MAKKKKLESTAPVPMTRGQLSRAQREQQQVRNLYTAGIALAAVLLLLLAFAVISTFIIRPNQEVASVNGTKISRATYNKLRNWSLYQQIQQEAFNQQIQQQGGTTGVTNDTLTTLMQQLKNVDSESLLDQQTVQTLVDSEVLRQKSQAELQINPTADDLKALAYKDFLPQPTPPPSSETPTVEAVLTPTAIVTSTLGITPTATLTPTATATPTRGSPTLTPTPTATLPPVPGAQQTAEAVYTGYIAAIKNGPDPRADNICSYGCPGLSESDYLNVIIEPRVRKDQVTEKLAATGIVTEVEQIHAQHILTDTKEGALKIRQMLDNGADFTQLAVDMSSDTSAKQNGGDVGWFPREGSSLVKEFVEGAFATETGKYSQPVYSQFGYHIIKVLERDPKRPLTQEEIDAAKTKLYDDWFLKAKAASTITPVFAQQQPTPTTPPLVEPTPPPAETPTPGAGEATPGASTLATDTTGTQTGTATGVTPTTAPATERNTPVGTPAP
ncbi:MAG: peptidylprolyl isomerase [Chloroflexota bacterium]